MELDRRLPFDEPYRISQATASAIQRARASSGRIIAVGTTVVRALEHAGAHTDGGAGDAEWIPAGENIANQRISPQSRLRVVNAILTGTHEPGSSHYELLGAFADESTLSQITEETRFTPLSHA